MTEYKDMRGVRIEVGNVVAYGKSDRYDPIRIGNIVAITDKHIEVLGRGAPKSGIIPAYHSNRIIVLPDNY